MSGLKVFTISLITYCLLFNISIAEVYAGPVVENLVSKKAAILKSIHKKAKKALVNSAQDRTFQQYFRAGNNSTRIDLKQKIDHISLNVQDHFHVEEMCLIDPNGSEISRIIGKKIATDLSHDEASAPFFQPGFSQKPRTVYVSPVYMSPDVDKWVLAYVTPITVIDKVVAILHYEHGLEVYQKALNKGLAGDNTYLVAVNEKGRVLSDSRVSLEVEMRDKNEALEYYFKEFNFNGKSLKQTLAEIDDGNQLREKNGSRYQAAYREVGNWTLVAFQLI